MIIDGKRIADQIQQEVLSVVSKIKDRKPCLAVILIGNHPSSEIYVSRKVQACEYVGIISIRCNLPPSTTQQQLLEEIKHLNEDPTVDGILIQLPLPSSIDSSAIMRAVRPDKDVDGFHPLNMGKLLMGETDGFFPCTPLGIRVLLERSKIETSGKHALIIGRSNIVGKPMAAILMQSASGGNATVTVAHSHTTNLKELCKIADILIVAMGKPQFLKADMVKEGAVIVDVGISKIENPARSSGYQIVGDVDFENVKDKCSFITPVPGGVGPMTIAMLLSNTLKSYLMRNKQPSL